METFSIIPAIDSPIIHSIGASIDLSGLQATIFISRPTIAIPVEFRTDIEDNSVYLIATKEAESFKPFNCIADKAVCISIGLYLDLLKFFKEQWSDIEVRMTTILKTMRQLDVPVPVEKNIHCYMNGTCSYQKWFDDSFLQCVRHSTDTTNHWFIHFQRQNKSLQLDPRVIMQMAQDRKSLVKLLERTGYKPQPKTADKETLSQLLDQL